MSRWYYMLDSEIRPSNSPWSELWWSCWDSTNQLCQKKWNSSKKDKNRDLQRSSEVKHALDFLLQTFPCLYICVEAAETRFGILRESRPVLFAVSVLTYGVSSLANIRIRNCYSMRYCLPPPHTWGVLSSKYVATRVPGRFDARTGSVGKREAFGGRLSPRGDRKLADVSSKWRSRRVEICPIKENFRLIWLEK